MDSDTTSMVLLIKTTNFATTLDEMYNLYRSETEVAKKLSIWSDRAYVATYT